VAHRSVPASEQWFARYLEHNGYQGWDEPEPDLRVAKRPDFLVRRAGLAAVCEVKEFSTSGLERRLDRPHNRVMALSSAEVYGGIRGQLKEGADRLKPLDGRGIPLVIVLANPTA